MTKYLVAWTNWENEDCTEVCDTFAAAVKWVEWNMSEQGRPRIYRVGDEVEYEVVSTEVPQPPKLVERIVGHTVKELVEQPPKIVKTVVLKESANVEAG